MTSTLLTDVCLYQPSLSSLSRIVDDTQVHDPSHANPSPKLQVAPRICENREVSMWESPACG